MKRESLLEQVVLDHVDDDFIGNEATLLHDALSLFAQLSARSDFVSEHVTSRQLAQTESVLQFVRVGTLTSTRSTYNGFAFKVMKQFGQPKLDKGVFTDQDKSLGVLGGAALESAVELIDESVVG